ncbi:MAG TPA: rhodanese-like domain-containing protein [Thermoanaerobaculia bacterium]|nr:rhodanese-like domain-containing protein [Thermoanaerobaculia bacterium]
MPIPWVVKIVRAAALAGMLSAFALAQEPPRPVPAPAPRPAPSAPAFPAVALAPRELDEVRGYLRLDVRTAKDFAAGHLPGAVRLDLGELARRCPENDPAEAACQRTALGALGIGGDLPLAVYGADLEFPARAFLRLEAAGCRTVRVLDGGWDAWLAAGLPTSRHARKLPPRSFSAGASRQVMIEPAAALAGLAGEPGKGGSGLQLLDLRDEGDWSAVGYASPPAFRAGHAPASLPWDPRGGLPVGGRLPEPQADRQAFERFGPAAGATVDPTAPFALLGDGLSGPRQAIAYLRLRALGLEARVVRGGFPAWQSAGLPVVRIVEPAEVYALLDSAALAGNRPASLPILDLRDLADYDQGHLPGAAPLPPALLAQGPQAIEAAVAARWPKSFVAREPLVILGYDRACLRGRTAAIAAARDGFRTILWLRDGIAAWRAAGLPVTR